MPKYRGHLAIDWKIIIEAKSKEDAADMVAAIYASSKPKYISDSELEIEEIKEDAI